MVADLTVGDATIDSAAMLKDARRIVVKIGSALLVNSESGLRSDWLAGLAADVAALREGGADVLIVSSGAIALGRRVLRLEGALALEQSQAAAAVGQIELARAYSEALGAFGIPTGQVLLTLGDTQDRRRYLNGRATLKTLLAMGVAPIVNENDTVATDEIRYGDNDRLAAQVALMAGADKLILLSDVDGLYTGNPRTDAAAHRLPVVDAVTPAIEAMAEGAGSAGAKGGMVTKIQAAKSAVTGGCAMAIVKGDAMRPIQALRDGAPCTWFRASLSPTVARKHWIGAMKPMGRLIVDPGAAAALGRGKSLLPAGVRSVEGEFDRGDAVAIVDLDGNSLGAALAGYAASEARMIAGHKSAEIAELLGYQGRAAMAHRDDMVLWS